MLTSLRATVVVMSMLCLPNAILGAERFTSAEGRFSVLLPGKPRLQEVRLDKGDAPPATQYQYSIGSPNGTIVIWYQEVQHISEPAVALKAARDAIVRKAAGPVKEERELQLNGHPGRYVAVEIPAMSGFVRSQVYFVSGRVYQINIVGTGDFVFSKQNDQLMQSFQIISP